MGAIATIAGGVCGGLAVLFLVAGTIATKATSPRSKR